MKNVPLKVKIVGLMIAIIFFTILTAYLSANYYISNYISESDSRSIRRQIELAQDNLVSMINGNIKLAESTQFSLNEVNKIIEKTGFHDVVKVAHGLAITKEGSVNTPAVIKPYLDAVNNASGRTTVSDVYFEGELPLIMITVASDAQKGNIFYQDLSHVQHLLEEATGEGAYLELLDSNSSVVFSNKQEGDLTPITQQFDVDGRSWTLTGYIDNTFIQTNTNRLNKAITIALLIGAVVITPISIILFNIAFRPIVELRLLIAELATGNGDLTHRLKVNTKDDLGQIADGVNRFIEKLQKMMQEVSDSENQISAEISKLELQADTTRKLINSHSSEMEMAVTSINEMSSTAESVAENAAITARQTQDTNSEAEKSKIIVQQALGNVTVLVEEVEHTSRSVIKMIDYTAQIGKALNVIGSIAEQTNLLALNATIEAARAGEYGRGFSVVADEVRALASRTRQSTEEVSAMLNKLKEGTAVVINSMDRTKSSCFQTAETTAKVMNSLDSMMGSVTEITDLAVQIATSAEEQSSVTEEINRNMIAMHEMIHILSSNGEATVNSTCQLTNSNKHLVNIVGKFKLE
ncbi:MULTISPECIES: methyl-accepting chemotaxis protein [unclassified Vibrio]|uniref:methyl-accepting chemotaxis protein n=1 Tax=unclassified Vibrio TaxID=2614977 RepID=UPI003550FE0B